MLKKVVVGIVSIIILIAVISAATSHKNSGTVASSNSGSNSGSSNSGTVAATTYRLITVLANTAGNGIQSLPAITIPADASSWALGWSYNCTGAGGSGNFIVDINGLGDTQTVDAGVNELGASGNSVENYYDTGTFQLVINSECSWDVKVTAEEPA